MKTESHKHNEVATNATKLQQANKPKLSTIILDPGTKVSFRTKTKIWEGTILQSHDPEIILFKLPSGYNIGIRESEILDAKVLTHSNTQALAHSRTRALAHSQKLRNVVFIITGGTISARLDPTTGGTTWTDKEEILNIAPDINKICNITKIESPFMKASEDMSFKDWKKLAEVCKKYLDDKNTDGIIITHGTDFLHYTSAALSFFIKNLNKPIAITYSQRSIDRASTDAALNLLCAAKFATSDIAEIALIGHKNTNDNTCLAMPARNVRKMHTSTRDAFKIINDTPLAEITPEKLTILKTFNARSDIKPKLDTKFSDKVAIIKIYPGQNPDILDHYQKQGYKGIILETTGLGHVPGKSSKSNWLPKIKKAIKNGIIICATAQTIFGHLNPNVYSAGRELQKTGIIFLDETSETALIKLSYILAHQNWNKKQKLLSKNI